MAKATILTGAADQPVHARTTGDTAESQVVVIGTDGSDVVLDPDTLATQATLAAVLAAVDGVEALLAVLRDKSADVATTLTGGRKTVASTGTAEAIRGTLACKWVTVTALKTNTSDVYVGGSGVVADAGSQTGIPLAAGEGVTIPVDDAAKVFVDVLVNSEGVTFLVGS